MFERERNYPTAVTVSGAEDPDGSQREAVTWAIAQHKEVGGRILIFVPSKVDLSSMDNLLAQLAQAPGVVVGTKRDRAGDWSGGSVIAAWPTRETLGFIADDRRTRALCVIPWGDEEVAPWKSAAKPELLGAAEPADLVSKLDPVVVAGLKQLTRMVNHSNNLAGGLDQRDAVAVIRVLNGAGYKLPADDVYSWAISNGWPERGAGRLREMVEKTERGVRLQMKGASPLRGDILDTWKSDANIGR